MRTINEQDMEDFLVGGKIMGAGGPGPERIRWLIDETFAQGKKFRLIQPGELPDSDIAVIISTIGGGVTEAQASKVMGFPRTEKIPELTAFRLLSKYIGKEPYALFPTELGAASTPLTMTLGAMLDKPTVDCDCTGRGKPELSISKTNLSGIPITPACVVTPFGDSMYLNAAATDVRAEDLLRSIAVVSGGLCGLARCPVDRAGLVKGTIAGTLSWAIEIGSAIRLSSEPLEAAIRATRGVKLFEGVIHSFSLDERDAFVFGETNIDGRADYTGKKLRVWFKNENMVSWLDEKLQATCPDAICILDAKTGLGLTNWDRKEPYKGRRVVVIGVPANRAFTTKKGLQVFGPRHFGFDFDYLPVSSLSS